MRGARHEALSGWPSRCRRPRLSPGVAALVLVLACLPARAQIVERVLAVVGGQLILLSDCLAALRFGLVDPPPAGADPVAATLPALIERQLQLAEINRYLPPEPAETLVDERLRAVRGRFPDDAAFEAALAETGLGAAQLRGMLRDDLRIASYRQQRFTNSLQPTEDELARYYRAHAAEFARDGAIPSFEQARAEARKRLIAERSSALIADWIEGLRRRAEVTILYRAQGEPAASGLASATS